MLSVSVRLGPSRSVSVRLGLYEGHSSSPHCAVYGSTRRYRSGRRGRAWRRRLSDETVQSAGIACARPRLVGRLDSGRVAPARNPERGYLRWQLDRRTRKLTDPSGAPVTLTKGEYALLLAFLDVRNAASTCCRPHAFTRMSSIIASMCRFFASGASSNATPACRA